MKYGVLIGNNTVWLDQDKLTALVDLLHGAAFSKSEYVGSGKGDDGGNYVALLRPFDVEEQCPAKLMTDDKFDTMMLKTKLFDEAKK